KIEHLSLFAPAGTAIQLSDSPETQEASRDITISDNQIVASIYGIRIQCQNELQGNNNIHIAHNLISLLNLPGIEGRAAIFSVADEVLIERNQVVLLSAPDPDEPTDHNSGDDDSPTNIFDRCWKLINVYKPTFQLYPFLQSIMKPVQTGI